MEDGIDCIALLDRSRIIAEENNWAVAGDNDFNLFFDRLTRDSRMDELPRFNWEAIPISEYPVAESLIASGMSEASASVKDS